MAKDADQPLKGIFYILLSMSAFSVMNIFAKGLTGRYDVLEVMFFRSFFVALPCAMMILWQKRRDLFATKDVKGHLIRGFFGYGSMLCLFYSFKLLPLADAVAIGFLGPVFATVAAMLFLREKAGWLRWCAIGAGLVGVTVMLQPGETPIKGPGFAVALGGAVLYGITMTCLRRLGRTEPATTTVWFFGLFATVASSAALPFVWHNPAPLDWVWLVLTGLFAFIGQLYVTKAYQYASAATISPFNYTTLIWAVLFGYLLWNEKPTPQILHGALIVIAAGICTALYEAWQIRRARRNGEV